MPPILNKTVSGENEVRRDGNISKALCNLQDSISILENNIHSLLGAINPILRSPEPRDDSEKPSRIKTSDICNIVNEMIDHIEYMTTVVNFTTARVDL